jgi:heme/copper-type cytochrome/quinol oxidase subunit 1
MHGTTMIFLAVIPLSTALINYTVRLLIGARDVAFPKAIHMPSPSSWRLSWPSGSSS